MDYLRIASHVSVWAHEIVPERPVGVRVLNEPIVIWRNAAGDLTAFEDRSVLRLARPSLGRCEGERLRRVYRGLQYDRTRRVIGIPGQDRIPTSTRVRTLSLIEPHSWVGVWIGNTPAPDAGLGPPVVGLERIRCGQDDDRGSTAYHRRHTRLAPHPATTDRGVLAFDGLVERLAREESQFDCTQQCNQSLLTDDDSLCTSIDPRNHREVRRRTGWSSLLPIRSKASA